MASDLVLALNALKLVVETQLQKTNTGETSIAISQLHRLHPHMHANEQGQIPITEKNYIYAYIPTSSPFSILRMQLMMIL